MAITVKTGSYHVHGSGLFHALESEDTILNVEDLSLIISFDSSEDGKPMIELKGVDPKKARLRLTNFSGSLGVGNTDMLKIGTLNEKELFIVFRVYSLDDKRLRTFEYTLYLK